MASLDQIKFTYDDLDEIWRIALETEYPDATNALYNGNYSLTLKQAQQCKKDWIVQSLKLSPGQRVLDIGSGWGNMLSDFRSRGIEAVGLTLSPAQADSCQRNGLTVYLKDWKEMEPDEYGTFDAIVSLGAFEHFCSVEEYLIGEQEKIYRQFFDLCAAILPKAGRLFLQTMIWGQFPPWGSDLPKSRADVGRYVDVTQPKYSDERILGLLLDFFPGSWLPKNLRQITDCAAEKFSLIESSDGRLDYVKTVAEWSSALRISRPKWKFGIKLLPRYIFGGRQNRNWFHCMWEDALREVFIRDIFGHQRLVFERRD